MRLSQSPTLENILETISSGSHLSEALLKHLVPGYDENAVPSQQHVSPSDSSQHTDTSQAVLTAQPGIESVLAVSIHQSEQSSALAAQTHQSDSSISQHSASATTNPLASHIHQSGRDKEAQNSSQLCNEGEHQLELS